jgi:class 3 adenylate cyclase
MTATRRLAAILAADVAGYSRLIGADEEGTLNRLKAIRAELVDAKIAAARGRIVKTTGDGLLVEFGSVVDALRCATEWQAGMAERNTGIPGNNRIEFRIGINVGDVVVDGDDIFGDGVNVAARLEALALASPVHALFVAGRIPNPRIRSSDNIRQPVSPARGSCGASPARSNGRSLTPIEGRGGLSFALDRPR